ncbi:DEAD-domain-containing protein [Auricularia subglabra TFB-10046 SS5]|nr:DEAD-domain-containing protein [Auricularia subglabra TFB-10046 SS5]
MQDAAPAPPAALPSFPLPTQPAPPSAETLSRQGLDSALLGAMRVDPHTTLDLDALPAGTLSERTKKRLKDLGIRELFAIQTALVPHLLAKPTRALYLPYSPPRDVCASAPTGSGKTLAYVLPLAELLAMRAVPRLRALIVLPTRDLVAQVREVFEAVAKGAGLRVGSVTGAASFAHEKAQLVDKRGESKVDVLVCTPGRLIDHLDGTEGFTLQHLRFLVIDEADRLLTQSFQDWLARVLSAITPPSTPSSTLPSRPVAPSFLPHPFASAGSNLRPDFEPPPRPSCQKMLLSATLTRDPGRLAALGLHHPQYFVVSSSGGAAAPEEFGAVPEGLDERFCVIDPAEKPLVLAWILREHVLLAAGGEEKKQVLVFCKSVEAATRLGVLLAAMLADVGKSVASYSSDAPRSLLERFRTGAVDVLVCSDLVSRGLDVPSVAAVLNYDAPVDARKYVHRVGRTARAGRRGDAWTMVEGQEARHFKELLAAAGRTDRVKKVRVAEKVLEPLRPAYEDALKKLAEAYGRA